MITDLIFTILDWFVHIVALILPSLNFVTTGFIAGLTFCIQTFGGLNFFFPFDTLFSVINSIIAFEIAYYSAKMVMGIIHFFRGSGEIKI